jgi:hypothetical protein
MTINAARVMPRATATVLRAFMVGSSVRGLGWLAGSAIGFAGAPAVQA